MKLVALSMVKNEEYWIWYSLTSVYPHVDELWVFDNHSDDRTVELIKSMDHIADKLVLVEGFGGPSEQQNREAMLQAARQRGGTHILYLDGDEVHVDENLAFCRSLVELHEHNPPQSDPPHNHMRPMDPTPTDGLLVKHIGMRPVHPGYSGPGTCRPQDLSGSDHEHGCYNYAIRLSSLANLRGNGGEWGQHGFIETADVYIQSSPHTLWLPKLYYFHFSLHPRSPARPVHEDPTKYGNCARDDGSVPVRPWVRTPDVLLRPDGPGNPTLASWGLHDFESAPLETKVIRSPEGARPQPTLGTPGPPRTPIGT